MSIVKRALGLALAVGCVMTLATEAQAAKALTWKFKQGETFDYAMKLDTDILIEANGAEFDVTNSQIFDIKWDVKNVDDKGIAEVTQTIDRIQLKVNTPFTGEFSWDSSGSEEPAGQMWESLGPVMKAMLGKEFSMKISPAGEISELKLPEDLSKALGEERGARMMMGGGMSEDAIKMMIARAVASFPADEVDSSKPWTQDFEVKMGNFGKQQTKATYTYEGQESVDGKDLDKIGVKMDTSLELADDSDVDIEMEITEQDAQGTIYFDAGAGRLVKSKVVQKMTMEGAAMGSEFTQELESTTTVALGKSDQFPADAEEATSDEKADDDKDADKEESDDKDDSERKDEGR